MDAKTLFTQRWFRISISKSVNNLLMQMLTEVDVEISALRKMLKLVSLCLTPAFSSAVLAAIFAKTKQRVRLFLQAGEPSICKVQNGQGSCNR